MNKSDLSNTIFMLALLVVAYFNSVSDGGFIWDDDFYVTENVELETLGGLGRIWADPSATPQYYPLTHTTFWIEHQLAGENPQVYRIVNLLLHFCSALVLFRLLRQLGLKGAWFAAFLFALHPVQVESVAWITERKNVLSMLFFLLSLSKLLKWEMKGARKIDTQYLWALAFFLCAMASKTVTATLPAVFLVVCWFRGKGPLKRAFCFAIPFFLVALLGAALTAHIEANSVGASGAEWQRSFVERIQIGARIPFFYLQKLLLPIDLCFNYPRWELSGGLGDWTFLFFLLLIVGLLGAFRSSFGRGPLACVLIFLGMLFPALGLIDVYPMRYSFVADHFQYHATAAVFALFASCSASFFSKRKKLFQGFCLITVLCLTFLTMGYAPTFNSSEALWQRAIDVNPNSWMAHNNLANDALNRGDVEAAASHVCSALNIRSDLAELWTTRALVHERKGNMAEALFDFEEAARLGKDDSRARFNLGIAYTRRGKYSEAIVELRAALSLEEGSKEANSALGVALLKNKQFQEAKEMLRKAAEDAQATAADWANLASLYRATEKPQERRTCLENAIAIDPEYQPALEALMLGYFKAREFLRAEAMVAQLRSLGLAGPIIDTIDVFLTGVKGGVDRGKLKSAVALGESFLNRVKLGDLLALDALASVYAASGEFEAALLLVQRGRQIAGQTRVPHWQKTFRARETLYEQGRRLVLY